MKKEQVIGRRKFKMGQVLAVTALGAGVDFIRVGSFSVTESGRWYFHKNTALAYKERELRPLTARERGESK